MNQQPNAPSVDDPIADREPGSLPLGWSVALWLALAAATWIGIFYFVSD